jgi:DNA invertase Pin-like site-specific DNA recombinase
MLTRRYEVEPTGNSRASLVTPEVQKEIRRMADDGKKPTEIGRAVGLGRKQVERILAKRRQDASHSGDRNAPTVSSEADSATE